VVVAEEGAEARTHEGAEGRNDDGWVAGGAPVVASSLRASVPVGYAIGHDQYFKRDDVGIIYQVNVVPERRRSLVGAMLVKAMFERAAWGCKLFCCWCAQDIEANRFWESLGFVPLAFRAGSAKKGRVHIFWQRRIREGDTTTPWWYPSKTDAGAMREDRIVLPIPPGVNWWEEMPIVEVGGSDEGKEGKKTHQLAGPPAGRVRGEQRRTAKRADSALRQTQSPAPIRRNGLWCSIPLPGEKPVVVRPPKEPKPRRKADPTLIRAARELRDRWLERVNDNPAMLAGNARYDVSRALSNNEPPPLPIAPKKTKQIAAA
jgi:GNAT superfamily N-acetyltransferase